MNCLLHGMEGYDEGVVHLGNALGDVGKSLNKVDVVLAGVRALELKVIGH
ncbi:MAG: hypothetical protein U5M23_01540 [Marinagarivorans sp.]|nr:hypothetical protein [Marinagarivorans sp.]